MSSPRLRIARFVALFAVAFAIAPSVGFTIAQPWHVQGHSMEPALADGSVLLVDAVGPRVGGYARGDIVVLPVPPAADYPHPILVKRIVALGGDHVRIARGAVEINGTPAREPYLAAGAAASAGVTEDVVVPPGAVFVMGDHRANSFDSTAFGPVPAATLVGRAWLAIAPGGALELPGAAAGAP